MNLFTRFLAIFANDRETETADVGFANQLADTRPPEWVEIPFGNHDHKNGLQVFDRASAETIVANFKSLLGARTFGGLPWYVGHPDVAEFSNTYKDRGARGWVKEMQVGDAGLRLRVKWNAEGEAIIANETFKYFSPVWGCAAVPGKSRQFRPVRMKSVGFTNEPNIGVMPLSNANEKTTDQDMNPKELAALLGLDPETATPETINTAITSLKETGPALANEKAAKAELETQLANEKAAKDAAAASLAAATAATAAVNTQLAAKKAEAEKAGAELANERAAFAAERKARIELLLANAIRDGRITEAQREPWANELTTAFDAKSVELANAKPAIHTEARTKNLGQRKETSDAAGKVVELANERMTKNADGNWDRAWKETLKEHADLALLLKQTAKA
jgi:phage I-like protein